ncbi:MAG TPA: dTDP-4-dehydrorhamnose reductase [Terracidiphilus sp.]|nr:dTDP-4-dehydrorhamnose reductase [Terracidiphilus sp.]
MTEQPRILVLGATGQVGIELQRSFSGFGSLVAANRESVDLADADQIRALVRRVEPNVILNAAAYTAVDRAESEPDRAMAINAIAPRVLAEEAHQFNALLVHYSTDYVFDGQKQQPWIETDEPNPLNVYGASKLAGERAIQQVGGRYLIFRTSWVYGPHGNNFLLTMLRLARERDRLSIVDDQFGSPTTSIQLALATRTITAGVLSGQFGAPQDWAGLYHMTCSESTTWFGFAKAIFAGAEERLHVNPPELTPLTTKDYPTPAKRPRNSVLSNQKLNDRFGVWLAPWQAALREVFQALNSAGSGLE